MSTPIKVMIVDDHAIVREGLAMLLGEEDQIELVGEASNGAEALTRVPLLQPDVILMDLVMPEMDGITATAKIKAAHPRCQVLVLTSFAENQRVPDAIQAGAVGYLLKDVLKTDLLRAIQAASRGEPTLHPEAQRQLMQQMVSPEPKSLLTSLTEREMDVLRLIARGNSNKEIAADLHLTEGTVKGYVSTILGKLQVADRTQAALYAVKNGVE
ncbi:MAG: response regulator transcription factor [Ardenticatenaceae bacterium]|nr:response regulator transcription factor [Ardenticatenaceae bacterium]